MLRAYAALMTTRETLRTRMTRAFAAGAAMAAGACHGGDTTAPPATTVTVPPQPAQAAEPPHPVAPAPATATAIPTPTATATPGPVVAASSPARVTRCDPSFQKQETYCFDANVGPPRQIPNPTFAFDAKGCVADGEVVNSCQGVNSVINGPTMKGKKCCYTVCRGPLPPCGRALTVAGDDGPRVAPIVRSRGWSRDHGDVANAHDTSSTLPTGLRARLRDAWLEDAAAEHASIASFARFALELLAVGAPADLVAAAHRAALDEIRHAEACFTIAGRYDAASSAASSAVSGGSSSFAAGPLSLDGVVLRCDLAAVAAAAADEACIGEAFSAMALEHAAAQCTDPGIRAVLTRTAIDEARHAELGWRFVGWAFARGDERTRAAITSAFERGLARFARADDGGDHADASGTCADGADDDAWRAAGRLTAADLRSVGRDLHRAVAVSLESLMPAVQDA